MKVFHGHSTAADAKAAVEEAVRDWAGDAAPEIVFAFVSTKQDPSAVAAELSARFPGAIIAGCTTSGEHLNGAHLRGSVVLTSVADSGIRWSATVIEGLADLEPERAEAATRALFRGVAAKEDSPDPQEFFCLSFIDGLRSCEESVIATIAEALDGVRLIGGSAGDDLAFKETRVLFGDRALTNAVVLVMGRAKGRFHIFKHQHFTRTRTRLAVTKVDSGRRRIVELDGRPAAERYAQALGLPTATLTEADAFLRPVALSCNGESFIRAVQRVHADGSISFFCGIEEGAVLEVAAHGDLVDALRDDIRGRVAGATRFELMLGFNCILRAIEAEQKQAVAAVGEEWRHAAKTAIGFDTYGEQLDGLHINQTLLAIGIQGAA